MSKAKNKVSINIGGKKRTCRLGLGFMEASLEAEQPDNNDITQVSTVRLLYHSLVYAVNRNEKEPDFDLYDIFDWVDEIGLHSPEIKKFQIAFFESLKVHMPDAETKKLIDDVKKELTPKEKKKVSKSGKKTGIKK